MSQAVDFIESNLRQAINVADMADAVSYSLFHFCRTFNQATHHTPYDYLMRRRLAESARALLQTGQKVIEIALDYQFNSPETFSRAFKRMFGLQPNQLRKQGHMDSRRLMPRLTLAHLRHLSRGAYLKPVCVDKDEIQVGGVMTLVKSDPAAIADLWGWLRRELASDPGKGPRNYYGITYYAENWDECGLLYMATVEMQDHATPGMALATKTIPAQQYARFIHKGPAPDLALTLDYVYHTWLPQSGRNASYSWVLEHYSQGFPGADDDDSEREIYIPLASSHP